MVRKKRMDEQIVLAVMNEFIRPMNAHEITILLRRNLPTYKVTLKQVEKILDAAAAEEKIRECNKHYYTVGKVAEILTAFRSTASAATHYRSEATPALSSITEIQAQAKAKPKKVPRAKARNYNPKRKTRKVKPKTKKTAKTRQKPKKRRRSVRFEVKKRAYEKAQEQDSESDDESKDGESDYELNCAPADVAVCEPNSVIDEPNKRSNEKTKTEKSLPIGKVASRALP